jgi:effector-binding domain-containing protein
MLTSGVNPPMNYLALMARRVFRSVGFAALLAVPPQLAAAQGQAVPRPSTIETAPLPPPAGAAQAPAPSRPPETQPSGGGVTLTQEPVPPATTAAPSALGARPTLVPTPGDPMDVTEVTLPGKTAAILSGQSTWEEGFDNLKNAFAKIEGELGRAGARPSGRPVTVFVETDDQGFRYEAMVPIEGGLEGRPTLTPEIRVGRTPEGKAYHFVHQGPYEDIDSTYETITAYLDAKGIVAKDVFIEEYVTDFTDSTDDSLVINIFVQPR